MGGDGIHLIDAQGRRYIDACGGAAVSSLGHGHARVTAAIKAEFDRLAYAHTSFFTSRPAEALADLLVASAPPGIGRVMFLSDGSEAVEAALKLARQYFLEIGQPERRHIIARAQSYHGNTLGALAVSGNVVRRAAYAPLLIEVPHIPPCYAYRNRQPDESLDAYGRRTAEALEAEIQRLGPAKVAAFIAEPVVGATLGAVPAVPGYFKRIREICDRHGVLVILDEVMCGMGRTGTLHACAQEGIRPDLLVLAKGLGAGYQPIGALLVAEHIVEAVRRGSGILQHGHTYMAHAVACAGALAVQQVIADENLLVNVRAQGARLGDLLRSAFADHPHIGDIRGRGLFWGIELVADRGSKQPFEPTLKLHARIKREAMARGLLCYPSGGTMDGRAGDHVLLAPPFIVTAPQLESIVERLAEAITAALATLAPAHV